MYSYNQYQLTLSHTHRIQESSVIAIQTWRKFSWAIQLSYRILVSFLAHMLEMLQLFPISSVQSCPTLCDPMNCSTPGLPVHHQLLEFTQTRVSIELVMPSSHLIFCRPLFLLPPIPPSIRIHSGNFHKPLVFVKFPWMTIYSVVNIVLFVITLLEFKLQLQHPTVWPWESHLLCLFQFPYL